MATTTDLKLSVLTKLERDHRKAEGLLKKLAKPKEASAHQALVDELLAAMAAHMDLEEQQLYPLLEDIDGDMAREARTEHGLARTGLQQMAALVGQPGFGAAVAMVRAGISHHVEEEEGEAFPKIRRSLGSSGNGTGPRARKAPTTPRTSARASTPGSKARSRQST